MTLVTAHTQDGSSLNWQALAQGGTTLVIYMGVAKLQRNSRAIVGRRDGGGHAGGDDRKRFTAPAAGMPQ